MLAIHFFLCGQGITTIFLTKVFIFSNFFNTPTLMPKQEKNSLKLDDATLKKFHTCMCGTYSQV